MRGAISGPQRQSAAPREPSLEVIRGHQRSSAAIGRTREPSLEVIRGHQRSSAAIGRILSGTRRHSTHLMRDAINMQSTCNQWWQSEALHTPDEGCNQYAINMQSVVAIRGTPHTLRPLPDPRKGANIHKAILDKDLFERLGQGKRISKFSLLACRLAERGRSWSKWSSMVISGHQWSSVVISGHQWPSVVLSGHQWSSVAISGPEWSSSGPQ
jgi:hypothetical protein